MNSVAFAVILGLVSSPLPFQHQDPRYVIVRDLEVNAAAVIEFEPDMTLTEALVSARGEEWEIGHRIGAQVTGAKILRDGKTFIVKLKPEREKAVSDQFKVQPYDVIDLPAKFF